MEYNAQFFLKLFKPIPSKNWNDHSQTYVDEEGKATHCVYGHLQTDEDNGADTPEGEALDCLLQKLPNLTTRSIMLPYRHTPARINNGDIEQFQQRTPKARIIAALKQCKEMGL